MKAPELLKQIRPQVLERVSMKPGRDAAAQSAFALELDGFYSALEAAVDTGNPAWLDPILVEWARTSTLSSAEGPRLNLPGLLERLISITSDVALEQLGEGEALDLLTTVTPIYVYALEKLASLELEGRMAHMSNELAQTRDKLEQLDRSKSQFISIAAHELRTPLTLIQGYATMLEDSLKAGTAPEVGSLLKGIGVGIQRLQRLVKDMIDVSMIDNDLLSLNLQPLQLRQILSQLQTELEPIAADRRQTLTIDGFAGSDSWIYADPDRLQQAFRNLLGNAIKYTPDEGQIGVGGRELPGFVEVTVRDTGIGISPEDQELIFEKHVPTDSELHSSSKSNFKGGGAGLGLTITRGIIQAHGGTIWVESEGCDEVRLPGSTFHVLIPARTDSIDPEMRRLFGPLTEAGSKHNGKEDSPTNPSST